MLTLHDAQKALVGGAHVFVEVLHAVIQTAQRAEAALATGRIQAAVHALLRILGAVDHGEDHAVRAALQHGFYMGGFMIRHAHERAASAGIGGHDGVLDHGLGHARVLVVDPDVIVAQQAAHLVEIDVGGGTVGAEIQLAGGKVFADSRNVVHKKAPLKNYLPQSAYMARQASRLSFSMRDSRKESCPTENMFTP